MPELPEVETTLRGIEPVLKGQRVTRLLVRDHRLRWPVEEDLASHLEGAKVQSLERRAKYMLIHFARGSLIWHLGMSGSMRIVDPGETLKKHDHIDLELSNEKVVRYNDPRRFGCVLWGGEKVMNHALLASLGPEPLSDQFDAEFIFQRSRGRHVSIKQFIMDQKVVVGVGNIYASEALFLAGIAPSRQAARISLARYRQLVSHIKVILIEAIRQGGTTLRDFSQADGRPGYFEQKLAVYGREGLPCVVCRTQIRNKVIGQRASYYCPACQR